MNEPFAPMPTPPAELARALGLRVTEDNEESEERGPVEFFQRTTAIPNPWAARVDGDGRLNFIAEDEEEIVLQSPIEKIRKLFQPAAPVPIAPKLGELPNLPEEPDASEREYFCPVSKLFHPGVSTTTASVETSNSRFAFTKRATPAPKEKSTLTYTKVVIGENVWNEGRDENGELMSMLLVTDESEE